jgi:hypothetical protein
VSTPLSARILANCRAESSAWATWKTTKRNTRTAQDRFNGYPSLPKWPPAANSLKPWRLKKEMAGVTVRYRDRPGKSQQIVSASTN